MRKPVDLKFKEYKPKEDRYHKYDKEKMIVKMSIDSKKIIALVKGRKLVEDLSDEQFQVLNLIKCFFKDKHFFQSTLNMWESRQIDKNITDFEGHIMLYFNFKSWI